ncbi:metallophosphoesterase family protein [Sphingomonas sp. PAMC 26605]|uniref:metallophosphoesterase family protein n=1 Tax=Sphingomonas sp. PAMC 26605 TaxID=1112214 RepID=UPI0002F88E28|nr:metallophosphoesterase family protein [Sphingomonas sp. PAMC 26605]
MFSKLVRRLKGDVAARRVFHGPPDARLYAVGDIHGRRDLLDAMLDSIREDIVSRPIGSAVMVFLGDLIDRGPDSAGVVERLLTLGDDPARGLFLLGNHEEVLLRVLAGEPGLAYDWLEYGGAACAESYGVAASMLQAMDEARIARTLAAAIPTEHVAFLEMFGDTVRFGDYLLAHAGIRPGVPIDAQQPQDLRWIREPFLSDPHDHGFKVIHGHTISNGVEQRANRIGIDTGAYRSGVLSAAVVEGREVRFLSTAGQKNRK